MLELEKFPETMKRNSVGLFVLVFRTDKSFLSCKKENIYEKKEPRLKRFGKQVSLPEKGMA